MDVRRQRGLGLMQIVAGLGVLVFAIVLVGLTNEGKPDWVSIVTAAAGAVLAMTGFYTTFHHPPVT